MCEKIAFEAPDFFGKTLLSLMLAQETGYTYVKFPNVEIDSGKKLLKIINGELPFDKNEYQELHNKNKLETLESLPDGNYIFDRYKLSEIVYGRANGLSAEAVYELSDKLPNPDITIIITGRPRGKDDDIFSSCDYQRRVKDLYKEESKNIDGRVIWVCNHSTPEKMLDTIWKELRGCV